MLGRALTLGLIISAVAGPWGPARVRADEPTGVTVDARAFSAIPAGLAVAVETADDSEENLKLCDAVRLELLVRHRRVAADGGLRLRVAADRVSAIALDRVTAKDLLDLPGERLPMIRDDLGTSPPDRSLQPLPPRERPTGGMRFRLHATLEERVSGRILWQGEAIGSTRVGEVDEPLLGRELASVLVSKLARTLR